MYLDTLVLMKCKFHSDNSRKLRFLGGGTKLTTIWGWGASRKNPKVNDEVWALPLKIIII